MLTELRITNVAIIDAVALPFERGLNVLSGETGAGKSIIVEALGLLAGQRSSADMVRAGSDKAIVEGVFDASACQQVIALLDERGIPADDSTVVLRREVVAAGRSRAWINNSVVTSAVLAEVGSVLVNIHGQHESHTLAAPDSQRALLDAFGAHDELVAGVASAFDERNNVRAQLAALTQRRDATAKRADYLRHVCEEISGADIQEGEDVRLEDEARRLAHVEELRMQAGYVREALDSEESGAQTQIGAAKRALDSAIRLDPSLAPMGELLDAAAIQLDELLRDLEAYASSLESEPGRLREVEARRDLLFKLTRKHGGTLESVIAAAAEASDELSVLDSAGIELGALSQRLEVSERHLNESAGRLSTARAKAARSMSKAVEALLPELGMADGKLEVATVARGEVARSGAEDVELRVSLNLGHEARPLSRVASGGELSRIMLALTTVLARIGDVPTLIFDEVDSGIGGAVALQVGDVMRRLAEQYQVFAITHLPQIASRAHNHIVVSKGPKGGVTTADVSVVAGDERVAEIARMLGGNATSAASRAHATELLAAGQGTTVADGHKVRRKAKH